MRLTGIITGLMIAVWAGPASAASPLTPAEVTVCKSVKYCVDIIRRHAPDEYDYAVLHDEFLRFGDKGKTALLNMLSAKDETDMRRAQILLAKGRFRFSPDEQRKIAALWPRGDLETHGDIMRQALSPLMRARMIDTLGHEDPQVRRISREVITASVKAKMDFPLRPEDYDKFARALLSEPTPDLVELLSDYEISKTRPVYSRLLKSGDINTTIAAYQKLFEDNPKTAFETLTDTLYELKNEDVKAAFALGSMLQHRHKTREDGFYLKFAKGIAEDPDMSPMGQLAGLHAVLNQHGGQDPKTFPTLANTPLVLATFRRAVEASEGFPRYYIGSGFKSAGDNPDPWIRIMWDKLKIDPYANPYIGNDFFAMIGTVDTALAKQIVDEALAGKRDFGLITLGIKAAAMQGDKSRVAQLEQFRSHPINDVRAVATLALEALSIGAENIDTQDLATKIRELNKVSPTCKVKPIDFRADVKRLPFFDLGVNPVSLSGTKRKVVSTIMPTKNGWLIGYDAGEWGGGLDYYENQSGEGQSLLSYKDEKYFFLQNVAGIVSVIPKALGRYSTEFWAFTYNGGFDTQAAVFRISETDNGFTLARHAQLPHRGMNIGQLQTGDVFISFDKFDENPTPHPPLLLSPNGTIRQACNAKADRAEALP